MAVDAQSGRLSDRDRTAARRWLDGVDRAAWQRFFLALLGLTLSLFLALYATGLSETGQYRLAAVVAAVSLLLAALVALRIVPGLARRTALQYWMAKVEYEFTLEGAVYLALIAVIAVAALNTGNNLLFIIFSCLLAGILASGVLSRIVLEGLELDLSLPDHLFAEQAVLTRLRLVNRKRFFPTFSVNISGRANFQRRRTTRPAALTPTIFNQDVYIPFLPRRSSTNPNVMLNFPKRGNYSQDSFRVSTRFPFGFIRKTRSLPCGQAVLVLPSVQPTKKFFEILPQLGSKLDSYLKGHSHDLYSIRDYQQSDSARHVDWKATARVGQLKVREFTRDDERRLRLVFDPWIPNSHPETLENFEKAVTLCACLVWYFYETGSTISFTTKDFETPMSSADQLLYPILRRLALIEPAPAPTSSLDHLLSDSTTQTECFQVIVTHQTSIPPGRWNSSYFVLMDSQ